MPKAKKVRMGRPPKYATGRRSLTIRLTEPLCQKISKDADRNGRSISEEIEHRLNEADMAAEMRVQIADLKTAIRTMITRLVGDEK